MPPERPTFDLQSHSLHSDGELPPREVVAAAAAAGVELLALTDHDTVDGVSEAISAGAELGIEVVPAVEVSSVDGGRQDLHVLGYLVDHRDETFRAALQEYRDDRERRAEAMMDAIRELGYYLDDAVVSDRTARGEPVGRPHIADAVVSHPGNAERLESEGLRERTAFLVAYLIKGKPAFRPRTAPTVADAIAAIHHAGGLAIWAHPFWDIENPDEVLEAVDRYRDAGVDGVECFYVTHTQEQTVLLSDRCSELGLLMTGSSDFHGPDHRLFSRFRAFDTYGTSAQLGPIASVSGSRAGNPSPPA